MEEYYLKLAAGSPEDVEKLLKEYSRFKNEAWAGKVLLTAAEENKFMNCKLSIIKNFHVYSDNPVAEQVLDTALKKTYVSYLLEYAKENKDEPLYKKFVLKAITENPLYLTGNVTPIFDTQEALSRLPYKKELIDAALKHPDGFGTIINCAVNKGKKLKLNEDELKYLENIALNKENLVKYYGDHKLGLLPLDIYNKLKTKNNFKETILEIAQASTISGLVILDTDKKIPFREELEKIVFNEKKLKEVAALDPRSTLRFLYYGEKKIGLDIAKIAVDKDNFTIFGLIYNSPQEFKKDPELKKVSDYAIEQILKNVDEKMDGPQKKTFFLKLAQISNYLHDVPEERFKVIDKLTSDQIYKTIVYGREEIFTSTFNGPDLNRNGMFDRLLNKLKEENKTLLDLIKVPDNKKVTIAIEAAAGFHANLGELVNADKNKELLPVLVEAATSFGRVGDLLSSFKKPEDKQIFINSLFESVTNSVNKIGYKPSTIENYIVTKYRVENNDALKYAVALSDAIRTIDDKDIRSLFEKKLINTYNKTPKGAAKDAYGLIISSYIQEKMPIEQNLFSSEDFAKNYPIKIIKEVPTEKLFTKGINIQQLFFYGDADGKSSYTNFMSEFRKSGKYNITDHGDFVELTASAHGRKVVMVANNPYKIVGSSNTEDGNVKEKIDAVNQFIKNKYDIQPQVTIHRGHSYHADKTMNEIKNVCAIMFWGSCGGYNNMEGTINISRDVSIISTKNTGTKEVNEPILLALNDEFLKTGCIKDWKEFWGRLKIKDPRFEAYVPPSENAGAAFIRSFLDFCNDVNRIERNKEHALNISKDMMNLLLSATESSFTSPPPPIDNKTLAKATTKKAVEIDF